MLSLFNIFKQRNGNIFYGILDTTENSITYFDSYSLKQKIKQNPSYMIDGLKIKELNSVGFGINKISPRLKRVLTLGELVNYTLRNIPLEYEIIDGYMCYTLVESDINGIGWSLQLREFSGKDVMNGNIIPLTNFTHLFGYDVLYISDFFKKVPDNLLRVLHFDFSALDLINIRKVSNLFDRCIYQDYVDFSMHSLINVMGVYRMCSDCSYITKINTLQIVDISSINCFPLPTSSLMFKTLNRNRLYLINKENSYFEKLLSEELALDLGVYSTEEELNNVRRKADARIAKCFLLNKPRYDMIFFARRL